MKESRGRTISFRNFVCICDFERQRGSPGTGLALDHLASDSSFIENGELEGPVPGDGAWSLPAAQHQTGIMSAKSRRVCERELHPCLTRDVGHVIEIALRVGIFEVDGGSEHLLLHG